MLPIFLQKNLDDNYMEIIETSVMTYYKQRQMCPNLCVQTGTGLPSTAQLLAPSYKCLSKGGCELKYSLAFLRLNLFVLSSLEKI